MIRRNVCLTLAAVFTAVIFLSCTKEKNDVSLFYGHWVASYGDTIHFYNQNGVDIVEYEVDSYSPGPPSGDKLHEYGYGDEKFMIRDRIGLSSSEPFREIKSFKWVNKGIQFKLKGYEWLPISSSVTEFTFTKIP